MNEFGAKGWLSVRSLVFVRHAMPHVDAAAPARAWRLTADGIRVSRSIDLSAPPHSRILASSETKAIQTVALIAGISEDEVLIDAGFDEVQRIEPVDFAYADRRSAWVGGTPDDRHAGWERFADVGARMDEAVSRHRADSMIIGTHGMALTAWLVYVGLLAPGAAAIDFWKSLAFPEIVRVTRRGGVERAKGVPGE